MALIRKTGKPYKFATGIETYSAYAVVDVVVTDNRAKTATVIMSVYPSHAIRDAGKTDLTIAPENHQYVAQDAGSPENPVTDFTDYMADDKIKPQDKTQNKQGYNFLKSRPEIAADWDSDE